MLFATKAEVAFRSKPLPPTLTKPVSGHEFALLGPIYKAEGDQGCCAAIGGKSFAMLVWQSMQGEGVH